MDILNFDWLFSSSQQSDSLSTENSSLADAAAPPVPLPEHNVASGIQSPMSASGAPGALVSDAATDPPSVGSMSWQPGDLDHDTDPSFFAFFTSRYALSLVIMGVLDNRIQHICRPRGRPTLLQNWKRVALRIPALLALGYSAVTLGLRTVHLWSQDYAPGQNWLADGISQSFTGQWNRQADEALLWITYIAMCIGMTTESLIRTLEGNQTPSPFNLTAFSLTVQSHNMEPAHVSLHFFFFVFLEVAEVFCLVALHCWKRPPIRKLPLTTVFGLAATAHYLLVPPNRKPIVFGFNRFPDVVMLGVIVGTVVLHALTMLLTEGRIDADRLLFSSSNLPSANDDYATALLKVGSACLQSTRLAGLSRELVSIEVPEKTYVELDEVGGVHLKLGFEDLINGNAGLGHEIKLTAPNEQMRTSSYQSSVWISRAKWRELKRFAMTVLSILRAGYDAVYRRLPAIPLPAWVYKLPRWIRLAWHGQNGERQRQERLAARAMERSKKQGQEQSREDALRALLRRNGVQVGDGEDVQEAARRVLRDEVQRRSAQEDAPTPDELGVDSRLWRYLLSEQSAARGSAEEDEEDDGEWLPERGDDDDDDDDDDDGEDAGDDSDASGDDDDDGDEYGDEYGGLRLRRSRRSRSRSRSRSVFSPTPGPADADADADPDEAQLLMELVRRDAGAGAGTASPHPSHDSAARRAFYQILIAHVGEGSLGGPPLTRARYLAEYGPPAVRAASSSSSSSSSVAHSSSTSADFDAHLRATILRRRGGAPTATATAEEAEAALERERQRQCVVCCSEERTIIVWPCRCLALCDGCREELASRPGYASSTTGAGAGAGGVGGLHNCPTCRAKVQGFSRVYLP